MASALPDVSLADPLQFAMAAVVPPPYRITTDDKRGLIVVITATTLTFVWTCFLIRIYLRIKTREWRSDDYFLGAATVSLCPWDRALRELITSLQLLDTVQSALALRGVRDGLGRSAQVLGDTALHRIGQVRTPGDRRQVRTRSDRIPESESSLHTLLTVLLDRIRLADSVHHHVVGIQVRSLVPLSPPLAGKEGSCQGVVGGHGRLGYMGCNSHSPGRDAVHSFPILDEGRW